MRVRLAIHEVLERLDEEREAGLEVDTVCGEDEVEVREGCGEGVAPARVMGEYMYRRQHGTRTS